MTDTVSVSERSRIMAKVHSQDTRPELIVRRALHKAGLRFRLHKKALPGKPDIVLPRHRTIVFVHGCFWHGHGCSRSKLPGTNTQYWRQKIQNNKARDGKNKRVLNANGWRVETLWECELNRDIGRLVERLESRELPLS
jgi:DNA mismatch endonuclease (patch repair protein)